MSPKNKVRDSRTDEAISRAALARAARLSEKTIQRLEEGNGEIAQLTKNKIVRAFNELPNKKREYTLKYLFPNSSLS